ncbi:MAG: PDZ domain-containing protein [Nitrospinae bacterium]|nr:PDZ domain-containing protein [Nitrospinota bacterium]
MFMQRKQWPTWGHVGMILGWMSFAGASPAFAEPEDASIYWQESTQGLGQEIVDDPALVQLLFAMPPDVMEEVAVPVRPPRQLKGWLGITMQEGPPLFPKGADDFAPTLEVLKVFPHSSAERAGLLPGDIILAAHGEQLSIGKENSLMMNFNRRVQDTGAGNILRPKIKRRTREMELPVELFQKPTTPVFIKPSRWEVLDLKDSLLYRILRSKNRLEDYAATVEEMREHTTHAVTTAVKGKTYNPFRLQEVNAVLNQPMDLPLISYGLTASLRKNFIGGRLNSGGLIRSALQELDFKVAQKAPGKRPADLEQLLDRLLAALASAEALRDEALALLTPDEQDLLYRGIRHLMVDSLEPRDLTDEAALKNQPVITDFLNTALKVDVQKLLTASFNIAQAIDLETLVEWKDNLDQFSLFHEGWIIEQKGDITYVYTRYGLMIVGGTGDQVYEQDALLIVDLGGNDRYLNGAGASRVGHPFSVVIDFSGDDVYLAGADHAQGAGILGGGFLIDLGGNDRYLAESFAQGAGVLGVGMLVDTGGRDEYRCHSFCQGAGFLGVGLIAESDGNDQYNAAVYAQGFGFVRGLGLILEGEGNDRYFAGGVYPDHREPGKAYLSMSQGFGYGIRPWGDLAGASGGIGILDDAGGNDNYVGDYFSQGAGYWYGLGILNDSGGHDLYTAGRYSQGAGIHLAAGILNDANGDDHYIARYGVSQGCGHDLAVGFLLDNGGNDRYIGGTLSQGAGNGNGFGVLGDNGGNDEYYLSDQGQGHGNPEAFRGLDSFGILFDTGGGDDRYSLGGHNNKVNLHTQWGIQADLP